MNLLSADEVAGLARVSKKSVQAWATSWEKFGIGDGPRPRRLSPRVTRYRIADVADWLGVDPGEIKVPSSA